MGCAEVGTARLHFARDVDTLGTALEELQANFVDHDAQGSQAYMQQMTIDHPGLDGRTLVADAVLAVEQFLQGLGRGQAG